jgi:hypothetical protein
MTVSSRTITSLQGVPTTQFYTATFASPVSVSGTFDLGLNSSSNNVVSSSPTGGTSGVGFYLDHLNDPKATQLLCIHTPPIIPSSSLDESSAAHPPEPQPQKVTAPVATS